ncbi:MAG: antibiotic biosynthesis monooxygenase [Chloroflexi bacterium]|nr:antibiotic biosynthesis monooxygenase [Chloroflexota bacterium]
MIVLEVHLRIKPDRRERFLEAIADDATCTRRDEPGNLRFDVSVDRSDPNHFCLHEVYRDDAAVEAHRGTPHFARWRAAVPDILEGAPDVTICESHDYDTR